MIGRPRCHGEVELAGSFPGLIPISSLRTYGHDTVSCASHEDCAGVHPRNSIAQPAARNGNQQHHRSGNQPARVHRAGTWARAIGRLGTHTRLAPAAPYEFERYLPVRSVAATFGAFQTSLDKISLDETSLVHLPGCGEVCQTLTVIRLVDPAPHAELPKQGHQLA